MKWNPVDIIVFTLTIIICLILLIASIKPFITTNIMPIEISKLIGQLMFALIAIISMYIGGEKNK